MSALPQTKSATVPFTPPAWGGRAEELAQWAMLRFVNRTDRCGRYFFDDAAKRAKPYAAPKNQADAKDGYLSLPVLTRHFRASDTRDVLGVYCYGADKFGKWTCIDIDNHDDTGDPKANEKFALHVYAQAAALGLCPLLYESNGKGGFHLWILFDGAVVAAVLHALGNWLVRDSSQFGFAKAPEVFPKNCGETDWGNWVRLPGRHHTRNVWPRVWDGASWVTDDAAVAHLLSLKGSDVESIPSEAAVFGIEVQSGGNVQRPERKPGTIFAWEDFNQKATLEEMAEFLQKHRWTRGRSRGDGAIEFVRPGKKERDGQGGNLLVQDGVPVFFCFTDAAPPLKPMSAYAPAALVATLDHDNDFKVSNEKLYKMGYGTRTAKAGEKTTPTKGAPTGNSTDKDIGELVLSPLKGMCPKAVRYLVPGRIPRAMLGLIAGDGAQLKSMLTLEQAAALSRGRCAFGLNYPDPPKGKTILISCEDDWHSTILPRLAALGADLSQILRVENVRMKKNGKEELLHFHMGHFRELEAKLLQNPDILLTVIDPAGAYIGRAGVNENSDAELRSLLGPLSEAANKSGACVLLVKHLNKSAGVSAVQRVGGGVAYVNTVRFSYMVAPDPDDNDRKLLLPLKSNVLRGGNGLAYRAQPITPEDARGIILREWPDLDPEELAELSKQLFRLAWDGDTNANANDIASAKQPRRVEKQEDIEKCVKKIRELLGGYSWPEKDLEEAMKKAGFSFTVYVAAKNKMRLEDKSDPTRLSTKPFTKGGAWWVWIGTQGSPRPIRPVSSSYETRESRETSEAYETCSSGCDDTTDGDGSKSPMSPKPFRDTPPRCKAKRLARSG